MALYDPVNGVYRKVTKRYDPIDGVYRKVTKAYDPVDGVYRQYFGGDTIVGQVSVGDSVWTNVNGKQTEFLVVQQGNPDATMYDESCNGTWLLWKGRYNDTELGLRDNRDLSLWLSGDLQEMLEGAIDSNVEAAIKQAKIPFFNPNGWLLESGIYGKAIKFFLLSGYEVGFTSQNSNYLPVDGACLEYFVGANNEKRVLEWGVPWLLRSVNTNSDIDVWCVDGDGAPSSRSAETSFFCIRPAFILDSNTPFIRAGGKNII